VARAARHYLRRWRVRNRFCLARLRYCPLAALSRRVAPARGKSAPTVVTWRALPPLAPRIFKENQVSPRGGSPLDPSNCIWEQHCSKRDLLCRIIQRDRCLQNGHRSFSNSLPVGGTLLGSQALNPVVRCKLPTLGAPRLLRSGAIGSQKSTQSTRILQVKNKNNSASRTEMTASKAKPTQGLRKCAGVHTPGELVSTPQAMPQQAYLGRDGSVITSKKNHKGPPPIPLPALTHAENPGAESQRHPAILPIVPFRVAPPKTLKKEKSRNSTTPYFPFSLVIRSRDPRHLAHPKSPPSSVPSLTARSPSPTSGASALVWVWRVAVGRELRARSLDKVGILHFVGAVNFAELVEDHLPRSACSGRQGGGGRGREGRCMWRRA